MRKRDFLKNQAVKQNSHQAWNDYKKARNEVNASIREAKVTFFNDSIKKHSGNLKETWNVINSSLGRKPKMTVINELIDEGKVFVQKEDIAEQMNNHFYYTLNSLTLFWLAESAQWIFEISARDVITCRLYNNHVKDTQGHG